MASVTHGNVTADTTFASSYQTTVTPAANDLLLLFVACSGGGSTPTISDTQNLGWTHVLTASHTFSGEPMYCFVANTLAAASSTTITATTGNRGGATLSVERIASMSKTGATAILQSAKQDNRSASTTPGPAFSSSALTTNPVLGAVYNLTNPAGLTPPTDFTELVDTGYDTPASGLEVVSRNSGHTSTGVTWGSTSASAYCDIIVELDASSSGSPGTASPSVGGVTASAPTAAGKGKGKHSPSVGASVFSAPTAAGKGKATHSPSAGSAVFSAPTASGKGKATHSPSVGTAVFSAPTASGKGKALLAASVTAGAFTALAISAKGAAVALATTATLAFSAPTAVAKVPGTTTAGVVSGALTSLSVGAVGKGLAAPAVATSAFSAPGVSVAGKASVAAGVVSAAAFAPTAAGKGKGAHSSSVAVAVFSAPTAVGKGKGTHSPSVATSAFSAPTAVAKVPATTTASVVSGVLASLSTGAVGKAVAAPAVATSAFSALSASGAGKAIVSAGVVSALASAPGVAAKGQAAHVAGVAPATVSAPAASAKGAAAVGAAVSSGGFTALAASAFSGGVTGAPATAEVALSALAASAKGAAVVSASVVSAAISAPGGSGQGQAAHVAGLVEATFSAQTASAKGAAVGGGATAAGSLSAPEVAGSGQALVSAAVSSAAFFAPVATAKVPVTVAGAVVSLALSAPPCSGSGRARASVSVASLGWSAPAAKASGLPVVLSHLGLRFSAPLLPAWRPYHYTLLRSHRNTEGGYPEHSAAGILAALAAGADCIEIDLWPSLDGHPIACHDATVDAVSDGSGRVDAKTLAELKAMRLHPRGGSVSGDHRFLALKEVIAVVRPYRAKLFLEPKSNEQALYDAMEAALRATRFPASRLEWLAAWATDSVDSRNKIAAFSAAPIYIVAGGRPSTIGYAAMRGWEVLGFAGGSYWPENFTALDYELARMANSLIAYYAASPNNLDLWTEANEGPGPTHFLSDNISTGAAMLDYIDGWKTAKGIGGDNNLAPVIFPAAPYGVTARYRTAGEHKQAILTARADPRASRVRCWWYQPERSLDGGETWEDVPEEDVCSRTSAPWPGREKEMVVARLPDDEDALARLTAKLFPR